MEFEYTDVIYIESRDMRKMYLRVKKGESFDDVFNDIMSGYDDVIYYACYNVKDDVEKEIFKRLKQSIDNSKE